MMLIQEYIKCFDQILEANLHLKERLSIETRLQHIHEDKKMGPVFLYRAHSIDYSNPIIREAHGLFLNMSGEVVCKCIDRPIHLNSLNAFKGSFKYIEEVYKGFPVMIYYHDGETRIASRTNINGGEQLTELFSKFNSSWDKPFSTKSYIYVFQIIASPEKAGLLDCRLIAIIDKEGTGEAPYQYVDQFAHKWGFSRPRKSIISGVSDIKTFLEACESEEVCVYNHNCQRFFISKERKETVVKTTTLQLTKKSRVLLRIVAAGTLRTENVKEFSEKFTKYKNLVFIFDKALKEIEHDLMQLWGTACMTARTEEDVKVISSQHLLGYLLSDYAEQKIDTIRKGLKSARVETFIELAIKKYPKEIKEAMLEIQGG